MQSSTKQQLRFFILLALVWVYGSVREAPLAAGATWFLCENVCSSSTACEETCYENMMEHENGNDITCLEWGDYDEEQPCCGDGVCEVPEDNLGEWGYCGGDCGPGPGTPTCSTGPTCSPSAQTGCSSGEYCAFDGCCADEQGWRGTPPEPPACFVAFCVPGNCCPGYVCLKVNSWNNGICYPNT